MTSQWHHNWGRGLRQPDRLASVKWTVECRFCANYCIFEVRGMNTSIIPCANIYKLFIEQIRHWKKKWPFNRFVSSKDFILLYRQLYKKIDSMLHKMSVCFVYFCLCICCRLETPLQLWNHCVWDTQKINICNKVVLIEFTDTPSFNQFCQLNEIHKHTFKNHTDNTLSCFHLLTLDTNQNWTILKS